MTNERTPYNKRIVNLMNQVEQLFGERTGHVVFSSHKMKPHSAT